MTRIPAIQRDQRRQFVEELREFASGDVWGTWYDRSYKVRVRPVFDPIIVWDDTSGRWFGNRRMLEDPKFRKIVRGVIPNKVEVTWVESDVAASIAVFGLQKYIALKVRYATSSQDPTQGYGGAR